LFLANLGGLWQQDNLEEISPKFTDFTKILLINHSRKNFHQKIVLIARVIYY